MRKYLLILSVPLLVACMASGPQKALDELAKAMETNNGQAFLACIDMPAFASNSVKNMTRNDDALNSLNTLTEMFGLGNLNDLSQKFGLGSINDLIGSVVDMQKRLSGKFDTGVATGELMAQCSRATTPDCPWVPRSLREATVVELGQTAAIAKITTPARLTSWLALRKIGDRWLVVGQAPLEATARAYATAQPVQEGNQKNADQDATRI